MSFKKFDGSTWQPITPKKLKGIPYTGTLPAVLTGTKAGYLHRYKIYGNTEQTGTPTPENPIVPSECGELETTGVHAGQYKLHLTSAGQNVDIYLGESQTTRRIKKLVIDGTEAIQKNSPTDLSDYLYYIRNISGASIAVICTHLPCTESPPTGSNIGVRLSNSLRSLYINFGSEIMDAQTSGNSIAGMQEYLAAQYANGTPVTVWYVLAAEETGTLNEPLRKIGDYADTIDSTQTNAQIPTSASSTTISWAGEGLAPSEFDSIREWVNIPTYTYTNGAWVEDN